ncbi:MFS transporter [Candidatus Poribacteria bacterium]|nr:MFS transporter [Candidatus Poribacteria bacterium]
MNLNEKEKEYGRKLFLIEGILSSSARRSMIGTILTAFALVLGSDERQIGILNSVRRLAGFLQLFTNHLLERTGSKRKLYIYVYVVARTMCILLALLPLLTFSPLSLNVVWVLISIIFIFSCTDTIGIVLKKTWMSELTPTEIRGRYFGLRNIFVGLSGMLVGYFSSLYVDYWRNAGKEILGFQSLFIFTAILGFSTLFIAVKIPEMSTSQKKRGLKDFLNSFKAPFRDRDFFIWMVFRGCYSFGVGFAGPFFAVYLLRELNLSLATVAIYTAIGNTASIALSGLWGSMADKYGNKKVLIISCIGKSIFPALWIFTTGIGSIWAILWLGFVHSVRGLNSAQQITMLNMSLWLSPEKTRPMYIACESTIVTVLSAVSPFIGGIVLGAIGDNNLELSFLGWNYSLRAMHILFFISAVLRSTSSTILAKVKSDSP